MAAPHPRGKVERRLVNGVLLLDKPLGLSSNTALQRVKWLFRASKAGHTGTLDPLASGLLPVCFGEATKFSRGLTDAVKSYRADVRLGIATETGDAEGRVTATHPVTCDIEEIEAALATLRGSILQVPHRFSALKRDGRALYDYARAGEAVDIAPRPVRIDELVVEAWASPVLTLNVRCSKGTYVRSLAESIGAALRCGAHVAALRRLVVGSLRLDDGVTLDALESMTEIERDALLLPLTALVADLPRTMIDSEGASRFAHGLPALVAGELPEDGVIAVFCSADGASAVPRFLGLGTAVERGGARLVLPARLLANDRLPAPETGT